ncbi:MAG: hypothetical protein ABIP64_14125 [Burkholderiales bacterium]
MKISLLLVSLMVVALSGCVTERVIVRESAPTAAYADASEAPPATVVEEIVTVRPSPVHVWIGGHWGWHRHAYHWAPGYWVRPPRYGAAWAPGAWMGFRGGWRWRPGYWR